MRRRITFTVSLPLDADVSQSAFIAAQALLTITGIVGYRVSSAKRSETYQSMIHVSMDSQFDVDDHLEPFAERMHYDGIVRDALAPSSNARFVCVDSVQLVPGPTKLAREVTARLERAQERPPK